MKNLILSSLLFLSSALLAQPKMIFNTWDGSFLWDTATVYELDNSYQVALSISPLRRLEFQKWNDLTIEAPFPIPLYIRFSKDQCEKSQKSIRCRSGSGATVYSSRNFNDLGERIQVISGHRMETIEFILNEQETHVSFIGARYRRPDETDHQGLSFSNYEMDYEGRETPIGHTPGALSEPAHTVPR